MRKERLDILLVNRHLCESREQAQRLILAGQVRVNGQVATKAGHSYPDDSTVDIKEGIPYVSRGGLKLEHALKTFSYPVAGVVALDVGSSTGGFTDCLLQSGAVRIYAVDVGRGQLHWRLRNDERVIVMEGINARHLDPTSFPERMDLIVIDVSFISLTLILERVTQVLRSGGNLITLIKPQFEAGRDQVGKGGVVRDPVVRRAVVEKIRRFGEDHVHLLWQGYCPSPILGPAGNEEFLACWKKP